MPTRTIIPPQTAAVATQVDFPSDKYSQIVAIATGLAGVEEVDVYVKVGSTYVIASDSAGAAIKLTATAPTLTLVGGPIYGFLKDATAAAAGVFMALSTGNKRG